MSADALVVIGGSAGSIEALLQLLPTIPPGFPAAIAVVVHRAPVQEDERLVAILASHTTLDVKPAADGMPIEPSTIVVCPANVHLVIDGERFALRAGPYENRMRPAIDVTLRTAATTYGRGAAGVLLSGSLDDGTAGLAAIVHHGGCAIVQDPAEAMFGDMPRNAINNVAVDDVLPLASMAASLVRFVDHVRAQPSRGDRPTAPTHEEPSLFSCPDCGGVLSQVDADDVTVFRCRTGHAYSLLNLFAAQHDELEAALWIALRSLVERADLSERLAKRSDGAGRVAAAHRFRDEATRARINADLLRRVLDSPTHILQAARAADESSSRD